MNVAQNKDADPTYGIGAELIAIAAVVVGGAAIFGGRGRVIGSCLGAMFIGLIDKVLREGVPITRIIDVGGEKMEVAAVAQLPPGRGAGLPRRGADRRGDDRALAGAPPRRPAAVGAAARPAAAADSRSRRHRHRRRADARHGGAGARPRQARARRVHLPARRRGGDPGGRALAVRPVGAARLLGRASTIPSPSCSPFPRSRCWRSA